MKKIDIELTKNSANYTPLNPTTFLKKVASNFPNRKSIIYNNRSYNWIDTYNRCKKFASALHLGGYEKGDIIERMRIQYEPNVKIWEQRGWKLYDEKTQPKKEPVKAEPVAEQPKDQTVVEEDLE